MSQSTNDSYPTAIKVALLMRNDKLTEELENLAISFRKKGDAYINIVKMGRTELQDAVPMTVGQEFHAWAASLESEIAFLKEAEKHLYAVNMGATAIGTGINAPEGYAEKTAAHLAKLTGKPIVPANDMLAATWEQQGFVIYSSALKSIAHQAVEDRQRSDPADVGAARRARRDQPPSAAARLVDHAGQSESRDSRAREPRRLSSDGRTTTPSRWRRIPGSSSSTRTSPSRVLR